MSFWVCSAFRAGAAPSLDASSSLLLGVLSVVGAAVAGALLAVFVFGPSASHADSAAMAIAAASTAVVVRFMFSPTT
ncbi:hypothetical protein CG747_24280 [Streptomyces sp. CB02959]|nr:hypothetical protein CG747_24280 [Streptomyces sp. CB02959]